jgi:hypothetical protein
MLGVFNAGSLRSWHQFAQLARLQVPASALMGSQEMNAPAVRTANAPLAPSLKLGHQFVQLV